MEEHNKHSSKNNEFSQQASNEFLKEEKEEEPVIPKTIITGDDYLRERYKKPPFDYSKAPKPFPIRTFPCGRHFSSDSDSESDSDSDSDSKAVVEEKEEEPVIPKTIITGDDYLRERYKKPPFDYSKAPKPFPIRTFPYRRHFSSDSESESDSDSDSDSKAIVEEKEEEPVKHGTKRPLEVGNEDSKPDDENEQS